MSADRPPTSANRWLVPLSLLIAFGALPIYAFRVFSGHLTTPWYVPIAAMVGVVLAALAMMQRRTILRGVALFLLLALVAFEGWFLFGFTTQPPYHGPVAVGKTAPEFMATRADGSVFAAADLKSDKKTILVFFRGRW
ncbi:MAG: hypothetical protein U0744_10490 [Gemmataceae bacterium]